MLLPARRTPVSTRAYPGRTVNFSASSRGTSGRGALGGCCSLRTDSSVSRNITTLLYHNIQNGGDRRRWRSSPGACWELERDGAEVLFEPSAWVVANDAAVLLDLVRSGAGIACVLSHMVADDLKRGTLIRVLADWCPPFPGYFEPSPRAGEAARVHRLSARVALRIRLIAPRCSRRGGTVRAACRTHA